jgi:hypothetical protein
MRKIPNSNTTRRVHEFFFSLNLSFTLTAFLLYGPGARFNWDPGSKVVTIHWLFPPAATVVLWLLLRIFQNASPTPSILRSVAGVIAIGATPLWFLTYFAIDWRRPWTTFHYAGFYEVVVALCCTGLYLKRRWPFPGWAGLLMLLAHHGFWLWQFQGYLRGYWVGLQASLHYPWQERSWLIRTLEVLRTLCESGWSDFVAVTALLPIICLLSGLAWWLYIMSGQPSYSDALQKN